jgi:hypothetical protein
MSVAVRKCEAERNRKKYDKEIVRLIWLYDDYWKNFFKEKIPEVVEPIDMMFNNSGSEFHLGLVEWSQEAIRREAKDKKAPYLYFAPNREIFIDMQSAM